MCVQTVLQNVEAEIASIEAAVGQNMKKFRQSSRNRYTENGDRSTLQQELDMLQLRIEAQKRKLSQLNRIIILIKKGWDFTCTSCEVEEVPENRVLAAATTICIACQSSAERAARTH